MSKSTSANDRGLKKQIYQDIFRTPDYFWFDPDSLEFAGFHLLDGEYEPITPNESGWFWSKQLRFFTPSEELVPTPEESAQSDRQQKELAQQEAAQLSAKLPELGIDSESL